MPSDYVAAMREIDELRVLVEEQQKAIEKLMSNSQMVDWRLNSLKSDTDMLKNNDMHFDRNGYTKNTKEIIKDIQMKMDDSQDLNNLETTLTIVCETLKNILQSIPDQDRAEALIKLMQKGYLTHPVNQYKTGPINYTYSWETTSKIAAYLLSQPESLVDSINTLSK